VGDSKRDVTSDEVRMLQRENAQLKRLVAEQLLQLDLFKKSLGS
jgi:hypothetical protein